MFRSRYFSAKYWSARFFGASGADYVPGDWPRIVVPRQVRTIIDPGMGDI